MSYAADHAAALADVTAAGASVSITSTAHSYDASTGRSTPSATAMTGAAVETDAERKWLEALGLVQTAALVLLFVATTYGDVPALDGKLTWAGATHTIKGVKPFNPDGNGAIYSYLAVTR